MPSKKLSFENSNGEILSARLELPLQKEPYPFAIFAHVFTGNKALKSARHISRALNLSGIAVLRFDFTGLGQSEGDFSDTNFSSNVEDIRAAALFLTQNYYAPSLIIGQSLGGAASLVAGGSIESVKAIATIGSPSDPEHVTHLLGNKIAEINTHGQAEVTIDGRAFVIKKQFIDDLKNFDMPMVIKALKKAFLVMHSPQDTVVQIENAATLYHHAKHPKSFITLDGANHMLSNKDDAYYTGTVIASWAKRYMPTFVKEDITTEKQVVARLEGETYTTEIIAGKHGLIADENENFGGNDFGPSPYELLNASLGACTAMTLQMYARRKKWDLQDVRVHLHYRRSYREDCEDCNNAQKRIDNFEREIELIGNLDDAQKERLLEIADKCPVHKTLNTPNHFKTILKN